MSRKKRNARIAMLSPIAFALAFGAYAGRETFSRDQRLTQVSSDVVQIAREEEDELSWLTDWLERHGQA